MVDILVSINVATYQTECG